MDDIEYLVRAGAAVGFLGLVVLGMLLQLTFGFAEREW